MFKSILNIILGVLTIAYPALVYFGLQKLPTIFFAGVLIVLFGLRLAVAKQQLQLTWVAPISLAIILFAVVVAVVESNEMLLYYPVIINLAFLCIFAYSLFRPPTIIERLARIQEPDLPSSGVTYTRRVTWVWCFFFASMASLRWQRQSLPT